MRERDLLFYRLMVRIRHTELRLGALFGEGLAAGTTHLSIGQEACAVGAVLALELDDYVVSTHRGHGHLIARGAEPGRLMAEVCGRVDGYCRGKGGSQHVAIRQLGVLGTNGITGGGIPVATGAAFSVQRQNLPRVVMCFFGDGAANQGTFHESLNMAAAWKLPIVFFCEHNQYAMFTASDATTSVLDVAVRAAAYAMPGLTVDGMDVLAVHGAARAAVERARSGGGPSLLEAKTYRFSGHSKSDDGRRYRPRDEIGRWEARDPLATWRAHLLEAGVSEDTLAEIEADVTAEIEEATRFALDSPYAADEATLGVYHDAACAHPTCGLEPSP